MARPVVAGQEVQRRRHGQVGRDVARALPLQAPLEHGVAHIGVQAGVAAGGSVGRTAGQGFGDITPADHARVQFGLAFGPHVQKGRAFGCAQPLVAVAGVEVRAQGVQVQVDLPWRVRAVDERRQAAAAGGLTQRGDGKDQRRGRRDVAGEHHPCARRDGGHHAVDEGFGVEGQRDLDAPIDRAGQRAHALPGGVAGAVFVVGGQHLVAGLQAQRLRHRVDARGGVGHEDQVGRRSTQAGRQSRACLRQQRRRTPAQKGHRVAFEFELPVLVIGEHVFRAGAETAVVQEDEPGLQKKLLAQGRGLIEHGDRGRAAGRHASLPAGSACGHCNTRRQRHASRSTVSASMPSTQGSSSMGCQRSNSIDDMPRPMHSR